MYFYSLKRFCSNNMTFAKNTTYSASVTQTWYDRNLAAGWIRACTQPEIDAFDGGNAAPGSGGSFASLTGDPSDNSALVALIEGATSTAIGNLVGTAPGSLNTLGELSDAINDDASFLTTINGLIATAVANVIASAPGALNTLDELANALGDDANFASTVTALIAAKASLPINRRVGSGSASQLSTSTLTANTPLTIAANLLEVDTWYEIDGLFNLSNANGNVSGSQLCFDYAGIGGTIKGMENYNLTNSSTYGVGIVTTLGMSPVYIGNYSAANSWARIFARFYSGSVVGDLTVKHARVGATGDSTMGVGSGYRLTKLGAPIGNP